MKLYASKKKCKLIKINKESNYDEKDKDGPEEMTPAKNLKNSQRYFMTFKVQRTEF